MEQELKFTHINEDGRAYMVDVSEKDVTTRTAVACGSVRVNATTFEMLQSGGGKKGNVLGTAQVAGIMGAKKTSELIPMCHTILINGVDMHFELVEETYEVLIEATVKCSGVTGVEMEALTAVTTAALTIYDMCKAVQKDIVIGEIRLRKKTGGKSGDLINE